MIRNLLLGTLLVTLLASAGETANPPKIKLDERIELATLMLRAQQAQINLQQLLLSPQMTSARSAISQTAADYQKEVERMREKYKVPKGCSLTLEQEWTCQSAEKPKGRK